MAIIGNSGSGSAGDSGSGWIAAKFTCPESGSITSIFVKINQQTASTRNYQVGIYTDNAGVPGTLLNNSSTYSISSVQNIVVEITIPSTNLTLGNVYHLVVQCDSMSLVDFPFDTGSTNQGSWINSFSFPYWDNSPSIAGQYARQLVIYSNIISPYKQKTITSNIYIDNNKKIITSNIYITGTTQKTIPSNIYIDNTKKTILSNIYIDKPKKTITSNIYISSLCHSKFIHNESIYIVTDTNPAKIIKVNRHTPSIYTVYTLTGKSNAKNLTINHDSNYLYVSLNNGYVLKAELNNPEIQTFFNIGEVKPLDAIAHSKSKLTTYIGDEESELSLFVIDESTSEVIHTDFRTRKAQKEILHTRLGTLKGIKINTDFRTRKEDNIKIHTDLRFNKYIPEEVYKGQFKREDFHIKINDIELGNDDLKLDSIKVSLNIDSKSTASFILLRKYDDINNPTTITGNPIVKIYIKNYLIPLEFRIQKINPTIEEQIEVYCEAELDEKIINKNLKNLPLPILNSQLNLYDVSLLDINIENPYIDSRYIIINNYDEVWSGSEWKVLRKDALPFNTEEEVINYILTFSLEYSPKIGSMEENPQYYKGIQVDLGKLIQEDGIIMQYSGLVFPMGEKDAEKIQDGTFKFQEGFTYFWWCYGTLYDFVDSNGRSKLGGGEHSFSGYIGTSLSSISGDFYEIEQVTWSAYLPLPDKETELGTYQVGIAPFKIISVENGKKTTVGKPVDKEDGLYGEKGESYDNTDYAKMRANLEYNKMKNINGSVLPKTSATIEMLIDAYLYYSLGLLTKLNLCNTTSPNIYVSNNGFPLSIKQITIDSSSLKVSLNCDNNWSEYELKEMDRYILVPEKDPGFSHFIQSKFDLQKWEEVERELEEE
jgi:hypothetical protein